MAVSRTAEELRHAALGVVEAWHGNAGGLATAVHKLERSVLSATADPEFGRVMKDITQVSAAKPGPYAVRQDELVAALERVRGQAKDTWSQSRPGHEAATWYGVMATAEMLVRELTATPERADALPEASPVAATPTSAHDDRAEADPSTAGPALSSPPQQCGVYHPYLLNTPCQVVPGDHIGRTHIWNGPDGTTVTWRHQ